MPIFGPKATELGYFRIEYFTLFNDRNLTIKKGEDYYSKIIPTNGFQVNSWAAIF